MKKNLLKTVLLTVLLTLSCSWSFSENTGSGPGVPLYDYVDLYFIGSFTTVPIQNAEIEVGWLHFKPQQYWVKGYFTYQGNGRYDMLPDYSTHDWLKIYVIVRVPIGDGKEYRATKWWDTVSAPEFDFQESDFKPNWGGDLWLE